MFRKKHEGGDDIVSKCGGDFFPFFGKFQVVPERKISWTYIFFIKERLRQRAAHYFVRNQEKMENF